MKKQTPESALTEALIQLLSLKGYQVKKIYNGGTPARVFNNRIIYKAKSDAYKGIPDLIAYNDKNFFFIEVKRKDGTVKPMQKEFIDAFNRCEKFEAIVVRDIQELIKKL